jgi:thiol:disulfide interchange protein
MTKDSGEFEKYFQKEYSIKGVPSYIFMNNGQELTSLRSTGYENAEDFLKRMQGAL